MLFWCVGVTGQPEKPDVIRVEVGIFATCHGRVRHTVAGKSTSFSWKYFGTKKGVQLNDQVELQL